MENESRDKRIGLVMVVQDEVPTVSRAFDSVLPLIDDYLICDGGSTDDTPKYITNYMKEKNIPGEVISKEWVNFGVNKTYLMQQAYEKLTIDYIIFLDADEVFLRPDYQPLTLEDRARLLDFADSHPEVGIFYFQTHYGGLRYRRWQMVRNDQLYRWDYPEHEQLVATKPCQNIFIDFIINHARKEGHNSKNPEKSKKYIDEWHKWLVEHPGDQHATFYLAQKYQDIGDVENAIKWYEKFTLFNNTYNQYLYIAYLRLGRLYKGKGDKYKALENFSIATRKYPSRLEAFYESMILYDNMGMRDEAFFVGDRAPFKTPPKFTDLFVEQETYEWIHQFKLGAICWYVDKKSHGRKLLMDLFARNKIPKASIEFAQKQLSFFPEEKDTWSSLSSYQLKRSVIIIDNFLENPDLLRKFALEQEFSVKGNYPGRRTESFATPQHKALFEKLLDKKITYWPTNYNGSFQYVTEGEKTWLHRDSTDYSAILYLSPDAPVNSGTSFYTHKELGITYQTPETCDRLNADSNNLDAWELVDQVGNKYNRLIIFDGRKTHQANGYFGTTKDDARLFQIFFFNC